MPRRLKKMFAMTVGAILMATLFPLEAEAQTLDDSADELPREEIIVFGRNEQMIGSAEAASEGSIGGADLLVRPMLRTAEVLEAIPGMVAVQHSGSGKVNREGAPIDLTGYWVSVVTEDWRWRMMTPPKGDVASLPLNVAGMIETEKWEPEADSGTCKPFGTPGLMRNPMRVRLEWLDDDTLQLQTEHGMQVRRFHFNEADIEGGPASLQGDSRANWQETGLKVLTTNLTSGYLRKSGVPYSADTALMEYYDRISVFGDDWLIVTTIVEDPTYLSREFITSTHYKKLADGESWNPVPCGRDRT